MLPHWISYLFIANSLLSLGLLIVLGEGLQFFHVVRVWQSSEEKLDVLHGVLMARL